jgi:hypothetical protein
MRHEAEALAKPVAKMRLLDRNARSMNARPHPVAKSDRIMTSQNIVTFFG